MRSLGLCVGASSLKAVVCELNGERPAILSTFTASHDGNPKQALSRYLSSQDAARFDGVALTGRRLKDFVRLSTITEPEAVETAARYIRSEGPYEAIVSAGGETFLLYKVDSGGGISGVVSGNKCASGTGEFFLQQVKRMGLEVSAAVRRAESSTSYKVSGRCSVFCKSDCTHALNRGEPIGGVCAGLCRMMADKILELTARTNIHRILLVGGTTRNQVMVEELRRSLLGVIVPAEAVYFEALGAALWALQHRTQPFPGPERLFKESPGSFGALPPLAEAADKVEFRSLAEARARPGDVCILGLDVGSTTTKAVLLRLEDDAILASVYLRTEGDPVGASRKCYDSLDRQAAGAARIVCLGTTGSGRQIAGLHALTRGVINEIIAHAAAAVYFEPAVDTIFEIGGQDAKYTYITAGVASDYAMNEACSAGTGSFLEEAALESLEVDYRRIEALALRSRRPLNFSDQCAAFINSDIKTALQEGTGVEDIMAGLAYSICANYLNKVKGARPCGRTIFMQGGVCYNKAVPIAMASLLNRRIIVPPHPGLMGAFGVALEVKQRLELGLLERREFSLRELADRTVTDVGFFACPGGKERCDRKCPIRIIEVAGERHPFGGACNRFYNLRMRETRDTERLNLVRLRQRLVFREPCPPARDAKTVGINRSFLTNTYYPLFYGFFTRLGLRVILPAEVKPEGVNRKGSSFCYPCDISHGLCADLLARDPDFLFLPHILEVEGNGQACHRTCPFVQGEPYLLREAFGIKTPMLIPLLWFRRGIAGQKPRFLELAREMGFGSRQAAEAFACGCRAQQDFFAECRRIGREFLEALRPEETAIVLFGRSYNAFAEEANMGIPHKFASRDVKIIPYDFLPCDDAAVERTMYWGTGRQLLAAARFVKDHPGLFAAYITNFSCGPDSFLITYFRDIMGSKPSLTLELDNHTADTGINTRVEAALDIIQRYRKLAEGGRAGGERATGFQPARVRTAGRRLQVVSSRGEELELTDQRVRVLLPSMGELNVETLASTLRRIGIHAVPLPVPDLESLKAGRKNSSCKECLPLQLTVGSLLTYLQARRNPGELTVFFMPGTDGPCRFGQYQVFIRALIEKQRLENVAVLSLNSSKGYSEVPDFFKVIGLFWQACIFADLMEEARGVLRVLARDAESALALHARLWGRFLRWLETGPRKEILEVVQGIARELGAIPLAGSPVAAKRVALVGEIYVRQDPFCQGELLRHLESRGFLVRIAPMSEWLDYLAYLLRLKPIGFKPGPLKFLKLKAVATAMQRLEKGVRRSFTGSGLCWEEAIEVDRTVRHSMHLMSPHLYGEAILTVGLALREILHSACGVISIGPFGCMPSRLAEGLLANRMSTAGLEGIRELPAWPEGDLPFLAIETDGSPFPQLVQARLEAFCLQADKAHALMQAGLAHRTA